MQRLDVTFPSQGLQCSAWLYLPEGNKPAPVVVMAHGLGGTREMRLDAFAERFCDAGYAAMVFDYRHFGGSEGLPRQLLDVKKQLQDWEAALAYVRTRVDVDGGRLVLWGTSFGGGHVLTTAADNPLVTAVISQCPFTNGMASSLAMPFVTSIRVSARAMLDQLGAWLGAQPLMLPLAGKPGATALMVAPDAEPGYRRLYPRTGSGTIPNYVAARFALQIVRYFPGLKTPRIACPVLFCICDPDTVAPTATTVWHARRTPRGEINIYPYGHFDIYVEEAFERVVSDQVDFLRCTVPIN